MEKSLLASRAFWGIVLMGYSFVAAKFGLWQFEDQESMLDVIMDGVTWAAGVGGTLLALWGRLKAQKKITSILPK